MNKELLETHNIVHGFGPAAASSVSVQRVSLKNYGRVSIVITQNKSTSSAGAAITLHQTTTIGNSPDVDKPVSFTSAKRIVNIASAGNYWESFAESNDTFTTASTASQRDIYVIDVKAEDLDADNGFDVLGVGVGDAANNTVTVLFVMSEPKYGAFPPVSAIVD